ncbi:ABC transporter permease subunit [Paenibacillus mendelii]|uniref:ABC transporter permease subunit n=1 Tax=Paenibacillus mendelii TaxID=206163 RepID=A0ABV6J5P3_9BACL|nr:ABC transporter permease subunit [Paenibacillus mendelii]MCQ6560088.1 ABC transporter permease subunit [Paenibacillus mendelii]
MNWQVIQAIAIKDIRQITSNMQVWLAMVIIPIVFCIVLPLAIILASKYGGMNGSTEDMIRKLIEKLPAGSMNLSAQTDVNAQIIYFAINYMLLPLFLMLPIITSSVISANSFVGEKERRTLESLLLAPIRIKDLFLGKILASFIPSYTVTLGGFILLGIVVDTMTYTMFEGLLFPSMNWIIAIVWLVPAFTLVSILLNAIISARVKTFQAAQQMSGLIVLPVIMLVISQMTGLMLISPLILVGIGGVLILLCFALLPQIARMNSRSLLFEKQIH